MATQLSKNFTLEELCASSTARARGINNSNPDASARVNLKALCANILQPLRDWYGAPIKIGSGYRCPSLNRAVGGVSTSQHMYGQAADLCIDGDKTKGWKWFEYIRDHLVFDQLIWEHSSSGSYWVHVSFRADGKNRKKVISNLLKK